MLHYVECRASRRRRQSQCSKTFPIMTRFLKLHTTIWDEGNVYRVVHLVEDSLLLTMQKWLRLRVISLYSGLGMKAPNLSTDGQENATFEAKNTNAHALIPKPVYTAAELIIWCQQTELHDQMDHPVQHQQLNMAYGDRFKVSLLHYAEHRIRKFLCNSLSSGWKNS